MKVASADMPSEDTFLAVFGAATRGIEGAPPDKRVDSEGCSGNAPAENAVQREEHARRTVAESAVWRSLICTEGTSAESYDLPKSEKWLKCPTLWDEFHVKNNDGQNPKMAPIVEL